MTPRTAGAWCFAPASPERAHWFPGSASIQHVVLMTSICGQRFGQRIRTGDFGPEDVLPGHYRCKPCRAALKAAS